MKMRRKVGFAAVSLLAASAADASVIYQWHPTSEGIGNHTSGGELVVSNEAYRSGSVGFDLYEDYFQYLDEDNYPIESIALNYAHIAAAFISSEDLPYTSKDLRIGLSFSGDRAFIDSAEIYGYETRFFITDGALKSIDTDAPLFGPGGHCDGTFDKPCGGSGYFVAVVDPEIQVPEPSSFGIWALATGLIGLVGIRRRRQLR